MSDENSGLKMRYSREKRLQRAGREVKELYESRSGKRGFFSTLAKNRGLLILFVTVIAFALLIFAYPYLTGQDRGMKLGAYRLWAEAVSADGAVTVSLDLAFASKLSKPKTGEVLVVRVSTDGERFSSREFVLSGSKEEKFFFRLPEGAPPPSIECLVRLGNSEASLRVPVESPPAGSPR